MLYGCMSEQENECMCHRDSLREKTSPEKKTDIVSSLVLEDRESMMEEIDKSVDFSSSMKAVLADLNALLDQDKDAFHRHDQEELRGQPSVGPSLLDMRSIDDYDWCMSMGTDGKVRIKSDRMMDGYDTYHMIFQSFNVFPSMWFAFLILICFLWWRCR